MKVAFRVDGSTEIGIGHVMRCATLADELRARSAQVAFLCRELAGAPLAFLNDKGFEVGLVAADAAGDAESSAEFIAQRWGRADWTIVDHYELDDAWEGRVQPVTGSLMVIDDIANRKHRCDILLDQNLYDNAEARYSGLTPEVCRQLLGPAYALLRPEFSSARATLRRRDGQVRRILIFFGGADSTDQTTKALQAALQARPRGARIDVIVGPSNPRGPDLLQASASIADAEFHFNPPSIAALMAESDLAIGAGGSTTWERLCMGLPGIVVSIADNQVEVSRTAAARGLIEYLGADTVVGAGDIASAIKGFVEDPERLLRMSALGSAAVDGNGCARVAHWILGKNSGSAR